MSKRDILAGIPKRTPGTTRIIICEEVFDYREGGVYIAVLHPLSGLSFMIEAPKFARGLGPLHKEIEQHTLLLKKAIWQRFTALRERPHAAQTTLMEGGDAMKP